MHKRIFTSIELPKQVIIYMQTLQEREIRWIKWMHSDNLHITLNFLGEITGQETDQCKEILRKTAQDSQAFKILLNKIIPKKEMLWVLPEKNNALFDLQNKLKKGFEEQGIGKKEKRRFNPHVLIAKTKNSRDMKWDNKNFLPQEFEVKKICLFESELTPGAATHTLIQSFPLADI